MTLAAFSRSQAWLLAAALFLLAPRHLTAQAATGELSITITDPSGASVKGAEVTISGTDTGNCRPHIEDK